MPGFPHAFRSPEKSSRDLAAKRTVKRGRSGATTGREGMNPRILHREDAGAYNAFVMGSLPMHRFPPNGTRRSPDLFPPWPGLLHFLLLRNAIRKSLGLSDRGGGKGPAAFPLIVALTIRELASRSPSAFQARQMMARRNLAFALLVPLSIGGMVIGCSRTPRSAPPSQIGLASSDLQKTSDCILAGIRKGESDPTITTICEGHGGWQGRGDNRNIVRRRRNLCYSAHL